MYSLAVRKRLNSDDHFWDHQDFTFVDCELDTDNGRYWFADPFLFEKDGCVYLFFEQLDLIDRKGKIGYSKLNTSDGTWSKPRIVISERCHFSFPFIFEKEGCIYIMPEMCGNHCQKIYKAELFPDTWVVCKVVHPDIYACDSILLKYNEYEYLLANEMYHNPENVPNGNYASCWVKSILYKLDDLNINSDGVKVNEGDHGVRNAGAVFIKNNKLYRIGQECRNHSYGKGLVLFELVSIQPFVENEILQWSGEELSNNIRTEIAGDIIGVHTYNSSEHYEVIDFSTKRNLKLKILVLRKLVFFVKAFKYIIRML